MNKQILEKVRRLNWIMQESPKGDLSFADICREISALTDSNVYIGDTEGVLLATCFNQKDKAAMREDPLTGKKTYPEQYNEQLMKVQETLVNLRNEQVLEIFSEEETSKGKYHTVIPIVGGGKHWGSMVLARYNPAYDDEDIILAEVGATAVGLEIQRVKNLELDAEMRREEVVQMAINTLSYSEYAAVQKIFEELDGEEGILVASKVADRSRITRSVIVNALRKLESAGVIESKSLGMKGTHIKVLNDKLFDALNEE